MVHKSKHIPNACDDRYSCFSLKQINIPLLGCLHQFTLYSFPQTSTFPRAVKETCNTSPLFALKQHPNFSSQRVRAKLTTMPSQNCFVLSYPLSNIHPNLENLLLRSFIPVEYNVWASFNFLQILLLITLC